MKRPLKFELIQYRHLNARQKENYNFQKVSGILAGYGFVTMRLSDDWNGADFIAQHIDGSTFISVQLKSRFSVDKKYLGKGLWICFPHKDKWYLGRHDDFCRRLLATTDIRKTKSWKIAGGWSYSRVPAHMEKYISRFVLMPQEEFTAAKQTPAPMPPSPPE